jgi:broad-specificity NMP kinase
MDKNKVSILISGVAGSGKSFIANYLASMGIEAYGIEDDEEMFKMYRKDTGEVFDNYENSNMEQVKNARWMCDVNLLKKLIEKQKTELAFYSCIADNLDEIIPLFDKFILLKASKDVLYKRLCKRIGVNEYGNTEEGRQRILGWKDEFEERMKSKGAIVVDADGEADVIRKRIFEKIS